ncbi:MAG TPA: AI-2E family transporter [Clostridia bacterium]|nr:AI-2E family transporter [Clostridia bacterium]
MTKVEKRKDILINAAFFILIVGAFYLFMKFAFSIFAPFIFAFFVAMALQRPVNRVVNKTPLKKGLVSTIMVLVALSMFVLLITAIGARIVTELKGLWQSLVVLFADLPNNLKGIEEWLLDKIKFLPDTVERSFAENISMFFNGLVQKSAEELAESGVAGGNIPNPEIGSLFNSFNFSILATPLSGVWSTAKQIPRILVATVISVIACCFMTSDYDNIVNFIKRQISRSNRFALSSTKGIFFSSIKKLIRAYSIIIFITFCEMAVGLFVLKLLNIYDNDYIIAISLIIAVVDIFPVLGTGTIIVPWSIYSFATGNVGLGIGLLIIYGVISVIRQVIEPKLVAMNLGMSPIVTIMCMYVGLYVFGFIGIFLLPLIAILLKLLNDDEIIHLWKNKECPEKLVNKN